MDASERGETIREFLDHAALVSDADGVDERAPVSLLTMHNAKGLEFPIVFVAGMEEGLFPHSRSISDSLAAMEEERRLCYVAMTRARKRLYLSRARYRRRFGGGEQEASIPSRFLKEVAAQLVQNVSRAPAYGATRGSVDLYAEQHLVRETVQRNLYTGKTLNSVDNIRQFFGEKGAQAPATLPQTAPRAFSTPVAPPPIKKKKTGLGSVIEHDKYGRGTIVALQGSGDETKVTVSFPGHGLKKLVAKYAGIKIE